MSIVLWRYSVFASPAYALNDPMCRKHQSGRLDDWIGLDPDSIHKGARRNRKAFAMTDTELRLIAALAIIGFSRMPKQG